jgi:hypothetical protein
MEDRLRYSLDTAYGTYPFVTQQNDILMRIGREYLDYRAAVMIDRGEGLTKTYNRFHNPDENASDIQRLRDLHNEMDVAVLHAQGWPDIAAIVSPEFLTEDTEQDHRYQGRLFWPAPFRDEVLARLLNLNAKRAADEAAQGLAPAQAKIGIDELEEV